MGKIKVSRTIVANEKKKKKEWPVVVYLWTFGLAVLGYMLSYLGVLPIPHTYHWTTGIIGGVLGILAGWIWYRWRGDIL